MGNVLAENVSRDAGGLIYSVPQEIVVPQNVNELCDVISRCDSRSRQIVVRGGGKTTEGESLVSSDELLLHMRGMNRVIDFDESIVSVEGGATYQEIQNTLYRYNKDIISAPLNISATVGGTLGLGGIDVNSAFEGCSADQVIEIDVILPSGECVTCSESDNAELFEAVLYGYGQFGVIARASVRIKKYSAIRLDFLYHNKLEMAIDDLLILEKEKCCDHLAILTLMDEVACVIVGFEDEEKYHRFKSKRSSFSGVGEMGLVLKKTLDAIKQPHFLGKLPFLMKSRSKILDSLHDPMFMREGYLHNRHGAFGKLIWGYWGKQPLVIPDLSLTLDTFKQGVLEGNDICKRYFSHYTLYIILVKKHVWKDRYDMGPFPETKDTLLGGVEFEPLFLSGETPVDKIQQFKDDIFSLGKKLNGRAYRFGGGMKKHAKDFCGDDNWNTFLDQKKRYDPNNILNAGTLK